MKIYTKTGDKGVSSLWGGTRISKSSLRMRAYGTIDELNSLVGVVLALPELVSELRLELDRIQSDLLVIGSDLATPINLNAQLKQVRIAAEAVKVLEQEIDKFTAKLKPLKSFIKPGGSLASAYLHLARSTCRSAEREVVALGESEEINKIVLQYINRLSDWLFTAARYQNHCQGATEVEWRS